MHLLPHCWPKHDISATLSKARLTFGFLAMGMKHLLDSATTDDTSVMVALVDQNLCIIRQRSHLT